MGHPFGGHIGGGEIQAVGFEQMQGQEGVIGVIIVRGAMDLPQEGAVGFRVEVKLGWQRHDAGNVIG